MPRAALLLLGCGPKGTEFDDDTGGSTTVNATVAPVVESMSLAQCEPSVDDIDIWSVTVAVSDPQGGGTLDPVGTTLTILVEDFAVDVVTMACGDDACTGSWRGTDNNVYCDTDGIFRIVAMDQDGNVSAPYDYDPP